MIVPLLSWHSQNADELIARIEKNRAFGRVAIACEKPTEGRLAPVLKSVAGWVDVELQLHEQDLVEALEYLNIGAMTILCDATNKLTWETEVPTDRLRVLSPQPGDQNRMTAENPALDVVADCFRTQTPILIDTDWLDSQPDFAADALASSLRSDRADGLWPTVIVDQLGMALGLAYSNHESLRHSLRTGKATYWSRSRNELWEKGKTSGATQALINVRTDCDSDCLRFQVRQTPPGFCHLNSHSCFGEERTIQTVLSRLTERIHGADEKSFTRKLANDPKMLEAKLLEEASELAEANSNLEVRWETADVLYFSLVKMLNSGVALDEVFAELARRLNRVVRRKNKLDPNDN